MALTRLAVCMLGCWWVFRAGERVGIAVTAVQLMLVCVQSPGVDDHEALATAGTAPLRVRPGQEAGAVDAARCADWVGGTSDPSLSMHSGRRGLHLSSLY